MLDAFLSYKKPRSLLQLLPSDAPQASGRTTNVEDWSRAGKTRTCCAGVPSSIRKEDHGPSSPSLDLKVSHASIQLLEQVRPPILTSRNTNRLPYCCFVLCGNSEGQNGYEKHDEGNPKPHPAQSGMTTRRKRRNIGMNAEISSHCESHGEKVGGAILKEGRCWMYKSLTQMHLPGHLRVAWSKYRHRWSRA